MRALRRVTAAAVVCAAAACGLDLVGVAPVANPVADAAPPAPTGTTPVADVGPGSSGSSSSSGSSTEDATTVTDVVVRSCPTGSVTALGRCYAFAPAMVPEPEARAACATRGAHLVTITTPEENAVVVGLGPDANRWIGLEAKEFPMGDANAFSWITGEPKGTSFLLSTGTTDERCAMVRPDGVWVDRSCTDLYASICERDP